jgi:hypothetical protein
MTEARGELLTGMLISFGAPLLVAVASASPRLMTKREVVYTYEDLAPHVKRIIERERVKAEIDAANRIQAALLPLDVPSSPARRSRRTIARRRRSAATTSTSFRSRAARSASRSATSPDTA